MCLLVRHSGRDAGIQDSPFLTYSQVTPLLLPSDHISSSKRVKYFRKGNKKRECDAGRMAQSQDGSECGCQKREPDFKEATSANVQVWRNGGVRRTNPTQIPSDHGYKTGDGALQ